MNYDQWKTTAPEYDDDPIPECPVCTGRMDADPCSEECDRLIKACERRGEIRRIYTACRIAIDLARQYRFESQAQHDHRVDEVIDLVRHYRGTIRMLRAS